MVIATQGFGLKEEFNADLTGTIRTLHNIGFQAIEPLILFREKQGNMPRNTWAFDTMKTAWETMRELNMSIPSAHIGAGFGWFIMPVGIVVENILMIHESYGIRDFVLSAPFGSASLAKRWAKLAKKISNAVTPYGCRILYHNHDSEFYTVSNRRNGEKAMDVFLTHTSPDVMLQVDIGWAGVVGDERKIMKRYADRIVSIHLKDFYQQYRNGYTHKNMPVEAFAPIGEGAIRTKEILNMVESLPHFAGNIIIDQDKSSGAMLDALKTGLENILDMLEESKAGDD